MNTLFFLSLGLNIALLILLVYSKNKNRIKSLCHKTKKPLRSTSAANQEPHPIVNARLRTIADACEAKLPEQDRGKIKLLVQYNAVDRPAILQIGELKISLCRDGKNQSLFNIHSFMEALQLANTGYDGTGRYIPVPWEVEFVLSQRHIINVYLEALGLELILATDDFWCVDTETGWNTGWKRFNWDVNTAFDKLHTKSRVRTLNEKLLHQVENEDFVKLFLLLKGWEHNFIEV